MATADASQITALYQAIEGRTPPAAELSSYEAAAQSGAMTLAQIQTAIENSQYTTTYVDAVIREYQAAFDRVPDQAGLAYWTNIVANDPEALSNLNTIFSSSSEFTARYNAGPDTLSNATLVTDLYVNVLGRAPDAAGLAYWSSQNLNAAQLLQAFSQSHEFVSDVASAISSYQDHEAAGTTPSGGSLYAVTPVTPSGTSSTGDSSPSNPAPPTTPQTFTLSGTGSDAYAADASAGHQTSDLGDTFNAPASVALNASSGTIIHAGAGADTLNILGLGQNAGNGVAGVTTYHPALTGVETINVTEATGGTDGSTLTGSTLDLAGDIGLTNVNDLNAAAGPVTTVQVPSLLNVSGITSTTTVNVSGEIGPHILNLDYVPGSTTANVVLGAAGASIPASPSGYFPGQVALDLSSGANNTIATLNISSTGSNVMSLDLNGSDAALTTITHSGAGDLLFDDEADSHLSSVTDTGTGNNSFVLTLASSGTISLGSGIDTLNAILQNTETITGGNGTDTFFLRATAGKAISLTTGSGSNDIYLEANAPHQITLGAGGDFLNIFEGNLNDSTGGLAVGTTSGNETSATFTDAQAVTINNFNVSTDHFAFSLGAGSASGVATNITTFTSDVDFSHAAMSAAHNETPNGASDHVAMFNYGGNAYVEYNQVAGALSLGDSLIKFVGVDANDLRSSGAFSVTLNV